MCHDLILLQLLVVILLEYYFYTDYPKNWLLEILISWWNFPFAFETSLLSKEEMAGLAMRLESLWYGLFSLIILLKLVFLKLCFYISNIYSSANKMKNYSPIIPPIYIMSSQMMAYAPDSSHHLFFFFILFCVKVFWSLAHKEGYKFECLPDAAKLLQSCPTLCDPIDGSPPGSPAPGILQARTLEWVAISFSNAWKWKVKVKSLSCVRLLATPWTAAYQAPPSMGFSRQEYWTGVPLPSPFSLINVNK